MKAIFAMLIVSVAAVALMVGPLWSTEWPKGSVIVGALIVVVGAWWFNREGA